MFWWSEDFKWVFNLIGLEYEPILSALNPECETRGEPSTWLPRGNSQSRYTSTSEEVNQDNKVKRSQRTGTLTFESGF